MKYYLIFTLFVFLGVMAYMNLLKSFVDHRYYAGLSVVPLSHDREILFGIYFNISTWYKVTDRTYWGLSSLSSAARSGADYRLGRASIQLHGLCLGFGREQRSDDDLQLFGGKTLLQSSYRLGNAAFYAVTAALLYLMMYGIGQAFPSRPVLAMLLNTIPLLLFVAVFAYKDLNPEMLPSKLRGRLPFLRQNAPLSPMSLDWFRQHSIAKDYIKLIGSSSLAQFVSILLLTVVGRLYNEAQMGTVGLFLSWGGFLAIAAGGRYEHMIVVAGREDKGKTPLPPQPTIQLLGFCPAPTCPLFAAQWRDLIQHSSICRTKRLSALTAPFCPAAK